MYSLHLRIILIFATWSGSLARADLRKDIAVGRINDVLKGSDDKSISAYIRAAEDAVKRITPTPRSVFRAITDDTIKLLGQFIEFGKSIQVSICSERVLQLKSRFSHNEGSSGFSFWDEAIDLFKAEYKRICFPELRVAEEQLRASLDKRQVSQVERLANITAAIIEEDNNYYRAYRANAVPANFNYLLNRLLPENARESSIPPVGFNPINSLGPHKFPKKLMEYLKQEEVRNTTSINKFEDSFDQFTSKPCSYYINSTSSMFNRQIDYFQDFGLDDEEFVSHLFEFHMCQFLGRNALRILRLLA